MFSLLTINAAIQDVRLFSRSVYRPIRHTLERLYGLIRQIRILDPDIICIQEMFHHDLQNRFHALLRDRYPYLAGLGTAGIKLRLDNELLVIAKYPLAAGKLTRFRHAALEERLFTSKGFYSTNVTLPGAGSLRLINFHMTAGGVRRHPENPRMEHIRFLQIRQLLGSLDKRLPTVLAGDLNAGPESSRTNYAEVISHGFIDAFQNCGGSGYSWDPLNPLVANHGESHLPAQRIDHIFLDHIAAGMLIPRRGSIVMKDEWVSLSTGEKISVSDHYG
ncbi:MAG: endonuclease/exonuclease/phosphatase family protein, partial [Gammaproteobacteria bacterium]